MLVTEKYNADFPKRNYVVIPERTIYCCLDCPDINGWDLCMKLDKILDNPETIPDNCPRLIKAGKEDEL